jgi:hypothetical protein
MKEKKKSYFEGGLSDIERNDSGSCISLLFETPHL